MGETIFEKSSVASIFYNVGNYVLKNKKRLAHIAEQL